MYYFGVIYKPLHFSNLLRSLFKKVLILMVFIDVDMSTSIMGVQIHNRNYWFIKQRKLIVFTTT